MKKGLLILLCIAGMALVPACKKDDKAKKPKVKKTKKIKVKKPKKVKKPVKKSTKKLVYCSKCKKMHAPGLHA